MGDFVDLAEAKQYFRNDIIERNRQKDAPDLLRKLMQHEFFDYTLEKMLKAKMKIDGNTIGYPSHWIKMAFSKNHNPEKTEDLKIRKLLEDNREWFETISVEESGFNPKLNAEIIKASD
jgi:hypothetical protein